MASTQQTDRLEKFTDETAVSADAIWLMLEDPYEVDHLLKAISVDMSNRIVNHAEFSRDLFDLYHSQPVKVPSDVPLPDGFRVPVLSLPPLDFEPDLFSMRGVEFVSRRFREALAQPDDVIQYWPVELARASEKARAQEYMHMRVLAWQASMDLERSDYDTIEGRDRLTGETFTTVSMLTRFVPIAGLAPRTEVFRSAEARLTILVVDSVAERVMRAGCTGVVFRDPETCWMDGVAERHRTADGVRFVEL